MAHDVGAGSYIKFGAILGSNPGTHYRVNSWGWGGVKRDDPADATHLLSTAKEFIASEYYDPRSPREAPRWDLVTLAPKRRLHFVPLEDLRALLALRDCPLLALGNRLSVMPLTPAEFATIKAAGAR